MPEITPLAPSSLRDRLHAEFNVLNTAHELRISRYTILVAAAGSMISIWIAFSLNLRLGLILLSITVALGLYHIALVQPLLKKGIQSRFIRGLNVTLEVSVTKLVSLLDVFMMGGAYALTSTPQLLSFLAVMAAGLRMNPRLAWYAGSLAAAQHLGIYALARSHMDPAELVRLPSLGLDFAIQHAIFLLLAGGLAALLANIGRHLSTRSAEAVLEQERLGDLFGAYVSPQALKRLSQDGVQLGGERRQATLLFADIRDFTPLAFGRSPEEVVTYLNSYFTVVCEIIARHGGMVNKFMGDGLLAVFGAPEPQAMHAATAATAALEMAREARNILRPDGEATRIGVGLHTGSVLLGSIGSQRRKDYTVIGDAVNLASRIEGLTRSENTDVLLSQETLDAAPPNSLRVEDLGMHQVKGREKQVHLYKLQRMAELDGGATMPINLGA